MVDRDGFRFNIGIVLVNQLGQLFWGRRVGASNAWQFPQGGLLTNESPKKALYRELYEEIGLKAQDVNLLHTTSGWIKYYLPKQFLRKNGLKPKVIGQKQRWYLLQLQTSEDHIQLDCSNKPEFESWQWVDYWHPLQEVIYFKRHVYWQVLKEFEAVLLAHQEKSLGEF